MNADKAESRILQDVVNSVSDYSLTNEFPPIFIKLWLMLVIILVVYNKFLGVELNW